MSFPYLDYVSIKRRFEFSQEHYTHDKRTVRRYEHLTSELVSQCLMEISTSHVLFIPKKYKLKNI